MPTSKEEDVVMTGASEPEGSRGQNRRQNHPENHSCQCPACQSPIDRSKPIENYKALIDDKHSAFVVAVRWYENEDSVEPWRELMCLDIRHAIADWGHELRNGNCRIELLDVCRCFDVYDQAVSNHKHFAQRVSNERQALQQKMQQQQQQSETAAARALLSVATK